MRKLASIQIINNIQPIENADRIELANVLGWQCVVNKGQFKPGDKAVYFEIDSFLPVKPEFEFLRDSSYKKSDILGEGFRLRTVKLRGQISQGLVLPISTFSCLNKNMEAGTDVTGLLEVKKWEIEERATSGGTVIGELLDSVPKTDEVRIQAMPELLNLFSGLEYYITTKMDGTSCSVSYESDGLHVFGHNYEYKDDGKSDFYSYVKANNIDLAIEKCYRHNEYDSIVIQGEFCAPGIQKNRLKLSSPQWYVFTILVNGERVGLIELKHLCEVLNLKMVPVEEIDHDLTSKYPTVESLLERADGEYPNGGKKEGIVIRSTQPFIVKELGDYLSMKVINNKYLLKNGD